MPEHQLLAHLTADILKSKAPALFFDHRVERHLHQHIAQLFLHQLRIVSINGLQRFAGLFQKVLPDGSMGLYLIPRTAVLRVPQDTQNFQQLLCRIGCLWLPVQHSAHLPCKRYCILYRISCSFARQSAQISRISPAFSARKNRTVPCGERRPVAEPFYYSCAPHLLQNSASSETGAPHCGQALCSSGWSAGTSSCTTYSASAASAGVRDAFRRAISCSM